MCCDALTGHQFEKNFELGSRNKNMTGKWHLVKQALRTWFLSLVLFEIDII
tara:strand:- start:254 stop:406 length:153 start_codon:yes stop_codon:yes gene_type:complete